MHTHNTGSAQLPIKKTDRWSTLLQRGSHSPTPTPHRGLSLIPWDIQEVTGAEPEEGSETVGTSAVQQVEDTFGIPVVSVVNLSHLMEFVAAEDAGGASADVRAEAS